MRRAKKMMEKKKEKKTMEGREENREYDRPERRKKDKWFHHTLRTLLKKIDLFRTCIDLRI